MNARYENLPADVRAALDRGETIDAIKKLRMATGLGLKEAKDVIDAVAANRPASGDATPPAAAPPAFVLPADGTLPNDVAALLRGGNKIAAIKRLRELTGLGLAEAKDAVEAAPLPARSATPAPATPATPVRPSIKPSERTTAKPAAKPALPLAWTMSQPPPTRTPLRGPTIARDSSQRWITPVLVLLAVVLVAGVAWLLLR